MADQVEFSEEEKAQIIAESEGHKRFEDIPIEITAILGSVEMNIANLLKIGRGAVIELDRMVGDNIELRCKEKTIGNGEVVIVNENQLAVSVTDLVSHSYNDE